MNRPIHVNITSAALARTGDLSRDALKLICDANVDSDSFPRHTFIHSQHFDDDEIEAGRRFLAKALERCSSNLVRASELRDDTVALSWFQHGLYAFGRMIHSIQDFYSHSNWICLTGPKPETWLPLGDFGIYTKVKTEYFEVIKEYVTGTGAEEYLKDPKLWLARMIDPDEKDYHGYMNYDRAGTIADRCYTACFGISGFSLACLDAKHHTARDWFNLKLMMNLRIAERRANPIEIQKELDWLFKTLKTWKKNELSLSIGKLRGEFNEIFSSR